MALISTTANSHILSATTGLFTSSDNFSISFWIYITDKSATTDGKVIFHFGESTVAILGTYCYYKRATDELYLSVSRAVTSSLIIVSAPEINTWTHIVVAFDKNDADGVRIYKDGLWEDEIFGSVFGTGAFTDLSGKDLSLGSLTQTLIALGNKKAYIGNRYWGFGIYDKALTADEVVEVYGRSNTNAIDGYYGYWHLTNTRDTSSENGRTVSIYDMDDSAGPAFPEILPISFREPVSLALEESSQTDACMTWEEWKWAFYHWKYNRDFWGLNEIYEISNPDLYFLQPPTSIIRDTCPPVPTPSHHHPSSIAPGGFGGILELTGVWI